MPKSKRKPSQEDSDIIEDIFKAVHLVEDKMLRAGLDKAIHPVGNKRSA